MRHNKKSQEEGRSIILIIIVLLILFGVMAIIIYELSPWLFAQVDRLF